MRWAKLVLIAVGLAVAAGGCGKSMLKTKGRVLKGGTPFVPPAGQFVRVTFVPLSEGERPADYYVAEVNQKDATFHAAGKDGCGMPPGRYRVAVELDHKRSDLLRGRFDAEQSPFVFDVDSRTPELVIDLDRPPAK